MNLEKKNGQIMRYGVSSKRLYEEMAIFKRCVELLTVRERQRKRCECIKKRKLEEANNYSVIPK